MIFADARVAGAATNSQPVVDCAHGRKVLAAIPGSEVKDLAGALQSRWWAKLAVSSGGGFAASQPQSVHVYHPRARLVNCDTFGDCIGNGDSSNPFTLTDPDDKIGDYLAARAKGHTWRG